MSFFPDITPLKEEIVKFSKKQDQIIDLLKEQNQLLKQLLQK
jgi:hypothetical protein